MSSTTTKARQVYQAYLWANGIVMVFDQDGEQVPELQGRLDDVREALAAAADIGTEFFIGEWQRWAKEVTREEFFREGFFGSSEENRAPDTKPPAQKRGRNWKNREQ